MAEADLKRAILERIQKEKESILNQARLEGERILKEAIDKASSLHEKNLLEIEKKCFLKKTKELNEIILEMKRQILEAKEKKVSQAFSWAEEGLKTILRNRERYKSIFRDLLRESLEDFRKDVELKVKVNPSDEKMALEILKELKINAELETTESIDAGLILSDLEERTIVLNTFKSRLSKLAPELRQEVSKILFGDL